MNQKPVYVVEFPANKSTESLKRYLLNSHKTIKWDISDHEELQCKMLSAVMKKQKILCILWE